MRIDSRPLSLPIRQSYLDGITLLSVEYTDTVPMKPEDADFGVTIDFQRGVSDPVKIFESMAMMLGAFKELDRVLIGAVDPEAIPTMVLEDVEAASITSWVRTALGKVDDDALKSLDIKKQIGSYAVKAKYKVMKFLDEKETLRKKQELQDLVNNLNTLGVDMPNRVQLFHKQIEAEDLLGPMDQLQDAKKLLGVKDKVYLKSDIETYEVDTSSTQRPSEFIVKSTTYTKSGEMLMVLMVKKPDYLGHSLWEFKNGQNTISAHVLDTLWLDKFRHGRVILQPGSALSCNVEYQHEFNENDELLATKHNIIEVKDTMPPAANQNFLFE